MLPTTPPVHAKRLLLISIAVLLFMNLACGQRTIAPEIQTSDFKKKALPIKTQGNLLDARVWLENGDSNIILISNEEKGEQCEKNYINRLFAFRASKSSGSWKKRWEIKDFGPGPCYIAHYQEGTLHVFDIDGQGPSETVFFYTIAQDGAAPFTIKMMFHWNGTKSPIRGKIPLTPDDSDAYEYQLDSAFTKAPAGIKDFAETYWKQYIGLKYSERVKAP